MRTQEELKSKEFQDDMTELAKLLDEAKIEYTLKRHEAVTPRTKELIGYYPTGEWHLKVGKQSIIRGYASFGLYEIYDGREDDPIRFETAKEMLEEIKKRVEIK